LTIAGATWPNSVRAASNNVHLDLLLDEPLGSGGEGEVFRSRHGGLAVKLCEPTDSNRDRMAELFARLRWLPLDGVPLCRPLEQLAPPDVGYVMELLEDMVPLRLLCEPPQQEEDAWYLRGGGLRRRLVLLARCAGVLATLHDRGIVYSDVSPGNVLISSELAYDEVRLIDADGLQTESGTGRRMGTPFYTAPELLRAQSGNTVFSDVYSFAVVAYEALTMNHPLIGDYVNEGEVELEDDAQRGLVPWVDHSTDDLNRTRFGYPSSKVLSRRLRELFRRTFEEGMTNPWARPAAGEWAAALYAAADRCLDCPSCTHSFFAAHAACPWCGSTRPPALTVTVLEQYPRLQPGPPPLMREDDLTLVLQTDRPLLVSARTVIRHAADPADVLVRLEWDGGSEVRVRNCGRSMVRRVPQQGGNGLQILPGSASTEHLSDPWWIHFDTDLRPHRILIFPSIEAADAR
jgi:eukaryotic-like serine/threonine-protein kinase